MWKDLFAFTKAERRGVIVFSILILLIILFRIFKDDIFPPRPIKISVDYIEYLPHKEKLLRPLKLSQFDPNTIDSLTLTEMHLPHRLIKNIINYRKAGGHFRKPSDLQKLYAVDSAWMDSLHDYISIKAVEIIPDNRVVQAKYERLKPAKSYPAKSKKWEPATTNPKVELNSADTTQLKSVYGIGSFYAKRIIKFRDLLGGYYSVEQLKEVYGMREETYQKIHSYLTVDTILIQKIAINKVWQYRLQKHPYCSKKQAKAIIHYRTEDGKVIDYKILKAIEVNGESWEKLRHYVEY